MLELYHHGSSVCAAKVRMYMHELDWLLDHLANDMRTFGSQSWPAVAQMLKIENEVRSI
jgi:hypothetical protein